MCSKDLAWLLLQHLCSGVVFIWTKYYVGDFSDIQSACSTHHIDLASALISFIGRDGRMARTSVENKLKFVGETEDILEEEKTK